MSANASRISIGCKRSLNWSKERIIIGIGIASDRRHNRFAMFYADVTVLRKAVIRCSAHVLRLVPKVRHELFRLDCDAGLLAIVAEPRWTSCHDSSCLR